MKRLVLPVVTFFVTVNLSGCLLPSTFKEGFIVDRKLQEETARNAARNSKGAVDFASKIYNEKSKQAFVDHVITETPLSEKLDYRLWATDFFRIYCNEKGGNLNQWQFDRSASAYSYTRGVGKKIITCEKANNADSLLLYEAYKRDSNVYPYETNVTFANGTFLKEFLDKNYLYGFVSSNGVVTFPITRIYDPAAKFKFVSDDYTVFFDYENTTNKPVEINLFNSYVTINGSKYDLGFEKGRQGQEVINWTFYSWGQESYGVFVGQEGSKLGKLRFNPGQKLRGEFKFKIPGKTQILEKDMDSFSFVIDGINCDNFKKTDYFTQNKKTFEKGY